jgi:peptidoglycan/xylan/chitin deacetylase (PgdA/CDA1 family)
MEIYGFNNVVCLKTKPDEFYNLGFLLNCFMKLKVSLLLFYYLSLQFCVAQQKDSKVYIAPFKNDAEGAYTIIHDDFGGQWADGIEQFADTMAFHRGIPFCFALIAGECDSSDWKNANQLIAHGHQVLNHSMHHKCGIEMEWCRSLWNAGDFKVEIDSSMELIKTKTGNHPAFFIFPFDQHTDTMISYLRYRGYAGARAGSLAVEEAEVSDPFYLNYKPYPPGQTLIDLDTFVKEAVDKKAWAIREVHGVNDASWGVISLKEYEAHLNFLKGLSEGGKLWVATLSDVLYYRLIKEKYSISSSSDKKGRPIQIDFIPANENRTKRDPKILETALATSRNHSLTIVVNVNKKKNFSKAMQNGKETNFKENNGKILIEADPEAGSLTLLYK